MKTKLPPDWQALLAEEINKPYFKSLQEFVDQERKKGPVYPPEEAVFNAFKACPLDAVKCVIIGQDPYHGEGQATGLSFSVAKGCKVPPSLRNIYKELQSDLGIQPPEHGDLEGWAKQGVLLLNTTLTVRRKEPLSHAKQGWELFTSAVIKKICLINRPIVFLLWGNAAKEKFDDAAENSANNLHLILRSAHPSPFSARKFLGCKHFSQLNFFLKNHSISPINFFISS